MMETKRRLLRKIWLAHDPDRLDMLSYYVLRFIPLQPVRTDMAPS